MAGYQYIPIDIYTVNDSIDSILTPTDSKTTSVLKTLSQKKEDFVLLTNDSSFVITPNINTDSTTLNKCVFIKYTDQFSTQTGKKTYIFGLGNNYVVEAKSSNGAGNTKSIEYKPCSRNIASGHILDNTMCKMVVPTNTRNLLNMYGERDILVRSMQAVDMQDVNWKQVKYGEGIRLSTGEVIEDSIYEIIRKLIEAIGIENFKLISTIASNNESWINKLDNPDSTATNPNIEDVDDSGEWFSTDEYGNVTYLKDRRDPVQKPHYARKVEDFEA